jgi:hypothetical protein
MMGPAGLATVQVDQAFCVLQHQAGGGSMGMDHLLCCL